MEIVNDNQYTPPDNFEANRFKVRCDILQGKLAKAAIELMMHVGNDAMVIPVARTEPQLFICIGNADDLVSMLLKTKPTLCN